MRYVAHRVLAPENIRVRQQDVEARAKRLIHSLELLLRDGIKGARADAMEATRRNFVSAGYDFDRSTDESER